VLVEHKEGAMKINGISIVGRSVSGYATAIALPEYGVVFDCGMATHDAVQCDTVVITHGHLDHLGDVVRHAYIRGMAGMAPKTKLIVPPWLEGRVHQLFAFWAKVQGARMAPYNLEVAGRDGGGRVEVGQDRDEPGRQRRFVRAFETFHRIRSQGYVLVEERKRLAPKYHGLSGHELGRLSREGVSVNELFEVPLVGFTGDTTAEVFTRDLLALKAKVLIVECTFLGDVTVGEARKKGHTHIDELGALADRFEGVEALVLAHFSKRYTNRVIEKAIATLPSGLREKTTYLPVGR